MPKPGLTDLFQRTEASAPAPTAPAPTPAGVKDRIVSVGVGFRLTELAELDRIAGERGVKRNALITGIVRAWLAEHA